MKICVYFQSGAMEEFSTDTYTSPSPLGSSNILSDCKLRTDLIAEDGLRMDIYWYNTIYDECTSTVDVDGADAPLPVAGRELGRSVYLISPEEMRYVSQVAVDGSIIIFRQGSFLINAIAFKQQLALCYSDASTKSINEQALALFDYLHAANPALSESEVCRLFGFPHGAYLHILEQQSAQLPGAAGDGLPLSPQIHTPLSVDELDEAIARANGLDGSDPTSLIAALDSHALIENITDPDSVTHDKDTAVLSADDVLEPTSIEEGSDFDTEDSSLDLLDMFYEFLPGSDKNDHKHNEQTL